MPIDYGSNNVSTSGNLVASSGNFTNGLTVNNAPVATGVSVSITNATDNRILTSTGASGGINAESNLTFDGTALTATGIINIDNLRLDGNTISSTNSNGNIIINPSGTGALQRDSGGDARGQYAVDWQTSRSTNTMVAAGGYSVVGGGYNNTSSGYGSTVGGGKSNTSTGTYSTVGGGYNNTNTSSGSYSTVGGGRSNSSSNYFSTVGGGSNNTSSGTYSTVGGGYNNFSSGSYSTVNGGKDGTALLYGEDARSSGKFNTQGDAQVRRFILRNWTTSSTSINLYLDGSSAEITIPELSSWYYTIKVIARNADDVETNAYKAEGVVERSSLSTLLLGATITTIYEDNGLWNFNTTIEGSDILRLSASVDASQNDVYWVAYVELVQVVVPVFVPPGS